MERGKKDTGNPPLTNRPDREEERRRIIQEYIFQLEEARDTATEQIKAHEEDLQQTVSLLQATLESTADGILVVDLTGKITTYNQKFAAMWQMPEDILTSRDVVRALKCVLDRLQDPQGFIDRVRDLYTHLDKHSVDMFELSDGRSFEGHSLPQYLGDKIVGRVWNFRDITERKRAEEALRQSEQRLQLALQAANQGWYDVNLITGEAVVSKEYATMLEHDPQDFTETLAQWLERLHPDDRGATSKAYRSYLRGELPEYRVAFRQKTASGDWKWIMSLGSVVEWTDDGKPRRLMGTHTDITTRKQAEDELQESRQRLASVAAGASLVLWSVDRQGVFTLSEGKGLEALGLRPGELVGQSLYELYPDTSDLTTAVRRTLAGEALTAPLSLGQVIFETRLTPLKNQTGDVIGAIGVSVDITERTRAEAAAQEHRERLALVFEAADLGSWDWNIQTGEVTFNGRWAEMLGYRLEDIEPHVQSWKRLVHPDDLPYTRAQLRAHLEGNTPFYETEHRLRHKSGAWVWVLDRGKVIARDAAGQPLRAAGTHLDISERKRMQEALEKRLVALSRPLDDTADLDFQDLFNLEDIQQIQDLFARLTGVASIIIAPDGTPITRPSNTHLLCRDLIRRTESGRRNCSASHALIGRFNPDGPILHHCLSAGLCNAGASITVGGKHIANWLIGQVRDDAPGEARLQDYARAADIDPREFISAFHDLPLMPPERFQEVAQALFVFANQLSAMAYQNVQQARFITERNRAEADLRDSEQRYRSLYQQFQGLLDALPDVICLISPDLKIVWGNEATAVTVHQPDLSHIIGRSCYHLRHDGSEPCDNCPVLRCFQSGRLESAESFSFGNIWELRAVPLYNDHGELLGAIEVARNISERKQAEAALKDSQRRLSDLIDFLPDATLAIDADGQVIAWNRAIEEMTGVKAESMLGRGNYEYALPFYGTRRPILVDLALLSDAEIERHYAFIHRHGDMLLAEADVPLKGEARPLWAKARPLYDRQGNVVGAIEAIRDISERRRMEEELRRTNATLQAMIQASPAAIIALDPQGRVTLWNPAAQRLFGWNPDEALGQPLPSVPDDKQSEHEALRQQVLQGKALTGMEVRRRTKDGAPIDISVSSAPLRDAQGRITGIISLSLDITAQKRTAAERAQLEARMREVQKLESLGVLAGGIAHDFNNLLMAILGNVDLALLSLSPAAPAIPHLEEISRASQRAADLCRQMLAYSGKGRFVVDRYDLSEIVREMAQMLEVSVSKKATLRYHFTPRLPAVEADATQLRQIVMNLITNASEALEDRNGVISVSTGVRDCNRAYLSESYLDDHLTEGEYVYLEVSDTGTGISPEARSRIFDPFFTTKFTGRGLGLAAVLGIVRGHRGAIKVSSQPGQGTTITVLLPAVPWSHADGKATPDQDSAPLRGGTILLVDDDPAVRQVAEKMLQRLGLTVLTAADGREALEIVQTRSGGLDCILLDLTMPQMGGEEVFTALRRLRTNVPVILSSGYNEQEVIRNFADQGLAGFIQKPYTLNRLRETLAAVLGLD